MSNPLDKYRRPQTQPQDEEETDEFTEGDGKTYAAYRPANKARRLIIRRAKEAHRAPGYTYLIDVMWDGDRGEEIGLVFSHATVMIKGKHLQDLARQLAGEKVSFIMEFDPARWPKPEKHEPVIDSIEYTTKVSAALSGEGK